MDVCYTTARNKVYLIRFTEKLLQRTGQFDKYSMPQIESLIKECAGDLNEIDSFFDKLTIEFAEWVVNKPWDKMSASLGVGDDGQNIAKSTSDNLIEFKFERGVDPDIN